MKASKKKAILRDLKKAGMPDEFIANSEWASSGLAFSGETYVEDNDDWPMAGDYYCEFGLWADNFGVNPRLEKILNKHGCYSEWVNAGVFAACEE